MLDCERMTWIPCLLRALWRVIRPLLSSKNPHLQNEAKCTTFLVEMSFICMRMKTHFHNKGWPLNLVLIQRLGELDWNGILILFKVFISVQINIFTEEVVFRVNITCKTIFILSLLRHFKALSVSIHFWYENGENNSRVQVDAHCFDLSARYDD